MVLRELPKDRDLEFPHIMQVKASAGSGKTYILSLRFLQFLLSDVIPDNSPARILAITFTNNATEEMRKRILKFLKTIYLKDESEILKKISEITTVKDIKNRSELLVEEILSNFDNFQVRTIDSFVNLIIRASTYELGLPPEYEIASSTDEFVHLAFERLISKIPSDQRIREVFYRYIEDLNELDFKPWERAREDITKFIEYEHNFHQNIKSIEVEEIELDSILDEIADQLKELLISSKGKNNEKIIQALIAIKSKASLSFILEKLSKLGARDRKKLKDKIEKFVNLYSKSSVDNRLTLFEEVKKEIEDIKRRSRKIFLSELNMKINEFLRASHPTWIYYKLGETIKHYLIDEFQDTSELQWSNIEPLVENSLSGGGSLFFVGDQKQLLYRFRGSSFKTFDMPIKRFGHYKTYEIVLDKNWRSRENIVEFVGKTFDVDKIKNLKESKKSALLTGEALKVVENVYSTVKQKVAEDKPGGRVVVKFGTKKEDFHNWLVEIIEDLSTRYAYRDIAVLLRNNSNVREVSRLLASKGIPVVSSSSLDIRNNHVIRAIKSLLTFLDFPPDNIAFAKFITSPVFTSLTGMNFENWLFVQRNLKEVPLYRKFREDFTDIWNEYLDDLFKGVGYYPPYDLIWQIVRKLKIFERYRDSEAFVQKLMDVIYSLEENGALSLKDILEQLEKGKESMFRLNMPFDENAVEVTTIHGAKGLEYEVVITWANERKKPVEFQIFSAGKDAYVFFSNNKITDNSDFLGPLVKSIKSWNTLDKLNILYVALTRAKSELYVFFTSSDKLGRLTEPVEIGEPLQGEPYVPKKQSLPELNYRFIDWTTNLANTVKGAHELREPIRRGDFIHRVLSRIEHLEFRPGELHFQSTIKEHIKVVSEELGAKDFDFEEIYESFERFFSNPGIMRLFEGGTVFTEKELFNARGEHLRIDRLVIYDDRIFVVEFKTGEPRMREHEEQVKNYKKAIRELHPDKKVMGFIVYFDRSEVVEV